MSNFKESIQHGVLHALCTFLLLHLYLSFPFDIATLFGRTLLSFDKETINILNDYTWVIDVVFVLGHSIEILLLASFSAFIVINLFPNRPSTSILCATLSALVYLPGAMIWEPRFSGLWIEIIWYVFLIGAGFSLIHHLTSGSRHGAAQSAAP